MANPAQTRIRACRRRPAAAPRAHRHPFVRALARALRQRCGVAPGSRVLIATSGGADSVALVRGLIALAPRRRWNLDLVVGHVQHHQRDADGAGERDARFVSALARGHGLRFKRADLPGPLAPLARDRSTNREARAGEGRYSALQTMARDVEAGFVAVAHHGDDQLETLLMRLLRGSTVRGLGGMAWRRPLTRNGRPDREPGPSLIRPLLRHTHADAVVFLESLGQSWCEDHTNRDTSRLRAHLRHQVLPVLREVRPDVAVHTANLTEHFRQVATLVEQAVDEASNRMPFRDGAATLGRADARGLSKLVLGGLLRRRLEEAGAGLDRANRRTIEPMLRAIQDREGCDRTFDVNGGVRVHLTRDQVTIRGPG